MKHPKKPKELNEEGIPANRGQAAFPWSVVAHPSTVWLTFLVLHGVSLTSQLLRQGQLLQELIKPIDTK